MPKYFVDRVVQFAASLWPEMLPKTMLDYGKRYEHHLILKVGGDSVAETEAILDELFASNEGAYFRCTPDEGERAFLHRFSAGGTVARFAMMNADEVGGIMPLDVALRRNDDDWFAPFPPDIADKLHTPLYCAHFLCHVFHMELAVKKGVDVEALKARMLEWLEVPRRAVSGRAQCRPPLRGKARAGRLLSQARSHQRDEPRHRQDDKAPQLADRQRAVAGRTTGWALPASGLATDQ